MFFFFYFSLLTSVLFTCIYCITSFDVTEYSKNLYKVLYNEVVELSMFSEKNISVSIWSFQYEF